MKAESTTEEQPIPYLAPQVIPLIECEVEKGSPIDETNDGLLGANS